MSTAPAARLGLGAMADGVRVLGRMLHSAAQDVAELRLSGARPRVACLAALSVTGSVLVACAMHLPDPWWAAISGFMSTQASRPESLRKAALRIIGTMAGAALALLLAQWLSYDHIACALALFAVATVGILGVVVSPHGYAWLFTGITFSMIVLLSLADPTRTFAYAVFRSIEVIIGSGVAVLVVVALGEEGGGAAAAAPGWSDLLGAKWPAVLHALRGGIAVACVPTVWSWLYLPGITSMAMTVVAVMAVPVLSDDPFGRSGRIVERAVQRVLGCLAGGLPALVLLALPLTDFVPWLLALAAGVWLFAYVQGSRRGVGYIGIQGALAYMLTLVQGEGPPASIMPGTERVTGMVIGLMILVGVCLVVRPAKEAARA